MHAQQSNNAVSPIQKLVDRLATRIRIGRAADYAFSTAAVCLLLASGIVALSKTGWFDTNFARNVLCILAILPIPAALSGWIQHLDKIALAQKIDQSHDLHDRFSTALTLTESPQAQSSAAAQEFSRAQIEDALKHVDHIHVAQAAPFRKPAGLIPFLLFLVAVTALWFYPVPDHAKPLPPPPTIHHKPLLDSATIAIERNRLEDIKQQLAVNPNDLESQRLIQEIEDLLTAVENQEISEREFLERLDAIEKKFFTDREPPPVEDLADALQQAAEALRKEAGKDLAQQKELDAVIKALEEKDLDQASKALEALAEKLSADNISAKDAEQLAKLLEKFADKIDIESPRLQELLEKHKKAFENLSEQFKDRNNLTSAEKDRLKKAEKDLKAAQKRARTHKDTGTGRVLEQLKKETKDMAEKLKDHAEQEKKNEKNKTPDPDQPDFQQQVGRSAKEAAEKLEQQGKEQQSEQGKQNARQQIEEMREAMKRAQAGQEEQQDQRRGEQVRDFLDRAKGQQESRSDQQIEQDSQKSNAGNAQPESGEQQPQQPDQGGEQSDKKGREQDGSGNDSASGGSDQENKLKQENQGYNDSGSNKGGEQDETQLDSKRTQENLKGEQGQGQSRSEIIQGASEQGFATTEYKDVYGDYSSVVEEVMEREKVPSGYRYYIKQYFQLIKPQQ